MSNIIIIRNLNPDLTLLPVSVLLMTPSNASEGFTFPALLRAIEQHPRLPLSWFWFLWQPGLGLVSDGLQQRSVKAPLPWFSSIIVIILITFIMGHPSRAGVHDQDPPPTGLRSGFCVLLNMNRLENPQSSLHFRCLLSWWQQDGH